MSDSITSLWTHGSATQYNWKEAESKGVNVNYSDFGCRVIFDGKVGNSKKDGPVFFEVFLPISTITPLSDIPTSWTKFTLFYGTEGNAKIVNLHLSLHGWSAHKLDEIKFPLTGDFWSQRVPKINEWEIHDFTLLPDSAYCLKITMFGEIDNKSSVLIAGAGITIEHQALE